MRYLYLWILKDIMSLKWEQWLHHKVPCFDLEVLVPFVEIICLDGRRLEYSNNLTLICLRLSTNAHFINDICMFKHPWYILENLEFALKKVHACDCATITSLPKACLIDALCYTALMSTSKKPFQRQRPIRHEWYIVSLVGTLTRANKCVRKNITLYLIHNI